MSFLLTIDPTQQITQIVPRRQAVSRQSLKVFVKEEFEPEYILILARLFLYYILQSVFRLKTQQNTKTK